MSQSNNQPSGNIMVGIPNLLSLFLGSENTPMTKLEIYTTKPATDLQIRVKNNSDYILRDIHNYLPSFMKVDPKTPLPDDLNPREEVSVTVHVDLSNSNTGDMLFDSGYHEVITH